MSINNLKKCYHVKRTQIPINIRENFKYLQISVFELQQNSKY